jgi:long-chain-fatty-acid--[acyl-carrier-protein] ligase
MLNLIIALGVRALLRLRYRIVLKGVESIARRGGPGILFLPNHPALIDPVILMSALYPRFRPRPLADRDQVGRPGVRWLAARMRVLTIPDPVMYGEACRREVEEGLRQCAAVLEGGGNVLLYPAGHIMRRRQEDLAGASGVETILARAPRARVVLVRTRGLWGSAFSRASGTPPRLGTVFAKAVGSLVKSGLFFAPRREVTIELVEPADLPRGGGRAALNRYLEDFYNREAPAATYVPYTPWEKGGVRELPEPARGGSAADLAEAPESTRAQVRARLQALTGRKEFRDDESLARDLNLDSLAIVDLALWVESEFGFPVADGTGLETVGDLLLAARGLVVAAVPEALKPVGAAWFKGRAGPGGGAAGATWLHLPAGDTLTAVFLDQAARGPDRPILADPLSGVKTYRDVITGILALRPALAGLPGERVGLMFPASVGAAVAYLATLFAGKVPVMVNWTSGPRNMTHSLDTLRVGTILTSGRVVQRVEQQLGSLGALKERCLLLEELGRRLGRGRKLMAWLGARLWWRRALARVTVPETAVILFTSGSESVPKSVPLTHGNLLANMRDLCEVFEFRADDRLIGILPPFHSFGLNCTMALPLCGGVPVAYHANPAEGGVVARLVEAYGITLLVATPTFLSGILRAAGKAGGGAQGQPMLRSLRAAIVGAEKCPESLMDLIRVQYPGVVIVEGYGITECSPVVSANDAKAPRLGTVGRVLPSVEYAVRDPEGGGRVAPGKAGVLLVRGPSIFGGYLEYEGASPFVEFEGRLWYRTGDLVVESPDGVLTFAGRLKRFVKLGGEMISLPAIEDVLTRHYVTPEDEEPVLAVEASAEELNPELVLFTIREVDREEVNRRLKEAGLSGLHNIRVVRRLAKIPLLGTGKTDYRALRAMARGFRV